MTKKQKKKGKCEDCIYPRPVDIEGKIISYCTHHNKLCSAVARWCQNQTE